MGSAGGAANMEAASAQGSLLNKVYEMQCAQQQQQQSTIFTVVGGRMVSSGSPMPLNGQQLMMQLDGITSAMTGMSVQEEAMDSSTSEEEESPFSQASAGGTLSTSPAWPHTLYLPHRNWNGTTLTSSNSSKSSSSILSSSSLNTSCS